MNVLVIDKDPSTATGIAKLIEGVGHGAQSTTNAKDALAKLAERNFDVVVLDICLPEVCGDRLIGEVRRLNPEVGIITMTAYNSRELEREIRKLGILYYIIKPVYVRDLADLLNHISSRMGRTSK